MLLQPRQNRILIGQQTSVLLRPVRLRSTSILHQVTNRQGTSYCAAHGHVIPYYKQDTLPS